MAKIYLLQLLSSLIAGFFLAVGLIDVKTINDISELTPFGIVILFAGLVLYGLIIVDKRLKKKDAENKELYDNFIEELRKQNEYLKNKKS